MKRPSLVRQTYTAASLVAMIPAAIWAAVAYNSTSMNGAVGAFPFYYLFFCQLMVIPRYVAAAWVVTYLAGRYKSFDQTGGVIGYIATGVVADIWLTMAFGRAISVSSSLYWGIWIAFGGLFWILVFMLAGSAVGGFIAPKIRARSQKLVP